MNRLLTTLLIWLLMAALPLHAAAVSINMSCAPVPQQAGGQPGAHGPHGAHAASAAPASSTDSHARHDAHAGHHGSAVHPDAGASDTGGLDEASQAKVGKLSHSSCSACSAFCAGAVAPPSFSLSLPFLDGSEAVRVPPADLVAGFIPDGLQRPPRQ
ncbi:MULTISPECIES: hypothetical protein [Massilia]|uniref:DUF2946 domain-containing protein n=1 Tax=Massilia haematophila TaxID=457923 RepID=A0ABV7PHY1_9BURK|nr:hypothetical protein [Massilia sp.]